MAYQHTSPWRLRMFHVRVMAVVAELRLLNERLDRLERSGGSIR